MTTQVKTCDIESPFKIPLEAHASSMLGGTNSNDDDLATVYLNGNDAITTFRAGLVSLGIKLIPSMDDTCEMYGILLESNLSVIKIVRACHVARKNEMPSFEHLPITVWNGMND
jgi:hypothetical protein